MRSDRSRQVLQILAWSGAIVVLTGLQLLRQRGVAPWDSIQSDDGTGFVQAAWSAHPFSLIFTPYAGYLQITPRLLAFPMGILPLSWAAAYFAISAALFTALLGAFVVCSSEGLIRQKYLRAALGLLIVLGPQAREETIVALAPLQFPLVFAAFWAVIALKESRRFLALRVGVVLLAGLSSPLTFGLIPVALVIAGWRRKRSDFVVIAALALGLLGQLITLLSTPTPDPVSSRTLNGIIGIYGQRVVSATVVGGGWLERAWLHFGTSLSIGAAILVIVGIGIWGASTQRRQWVYAGLALILSPIFVIFSLNSRGLVPLLVAIPGFFTYDGERYFVIPILFLVSGLILLAGGPSRAGRKRLMPIAAVFRVVLVIQIVVVVVIGFRVDTMRSPGPRWAEQIRNAEHVCQRDSKAILYLLYSPTNFNSKVNCSDL